MKWRLATFAMIPFFFACATPQKKYAVPLTKVTHIKFSHQQDRQYVGIFTSKKVPFHVDYSRTEKKLTISLKNAVFSHASRTLNHQRNAIRDVHMHYLRTESRGILSTLVFDLTKPYHYDVKNTSFGIEIVFDLSRMMAER